MRQNDDCNITECVFYPYSALQRLQERINELEARPGAIADGAVGAGGDTTDDQTLDTSQVMMDRPTAPMAVSGPPVGDRAESGDETLQREAEEVGVLAIGGLDHYSENKYSMRRSFTRR